MIHGCDIYIICIIVWWTYYIYRGAFGRRSFTVFHFRRRDLYDILTEQVMVNCERVPDLVAALAPLHQVLLGTEGQKGAAVRARLPTGHNGIGEVEWSPWLGDLHTLAEKNHNKTGFFLQSGGFHAAHGVLQPITISLLAMSPVCNPWAVTVTTTEGLSIASCSTGCSGLFWTTKSFLDDRSYEDLIRFVKIWDFYGSNQWFGTISLTWSGFCIFGLDTVRTMSNDD